jgi:acetyl-CoA carboxylase beta subunit
VGIIVNQGSVNCMQEGSFSSMQMAKIASTLYIHQKDKRLLYVGFLTTM